MANQRVSRILCAGNPQGSVEAIRRLLALADERDVQAIALVGDLGAAHDGYREVFRALAASASPVYWVPGPADAPSDRYLREAYNIETAFPLLHGVHGTAAFGPGGVLFAGMGGDINDGPEGAQDDRKRLSYPRWELEYRLKLLREVEYNELVLLLWTPPAHKGIGSSGSQAVAELVNTYRPRLVICGGEQMSEVLGRSPVLSPGNLRTGQYAVADLRSQSVGLADVAVAAPEA
jgi:Icc-related predicted phosphoesterase